MRIRLGFSIVAVSSVLACSSSNTTEDPVADAGHDGATETAIGTDSGASDTRPLDDGAIPPKCPTSHPVRCGSATCAVGSICAVVGKAFDAGGDASEAGPTDAAPPDSVAGSCIAAPPECITNCPATDCVCVAWKLATDCSIDSVASCASASDGIVPVVYCTK